MSKKNLIKILKYTSPNHLYIITLDNVLIKLICPFGVIVLQDVGELKTGEIVNVERVKVTYQMITVFSIQNKLYYYYHFDFVLE